MLAEVSKLKSAEQQLNVLGVVVKSGLKRQEHNQRAESDFEENIF